MDSSEQDQDNFDLSSLFKEDKEHVLEKYSNMDNLVSELDEEAINSIVSKVLSGMNDDQTSQSKWMSDTEDALRLSKLTKEPKNTPRPDAANIKYPLITIACYQYAARTYPEIIQDNKVVKTEIIGETNPLIDMIAYGVSIHMSYQLLGADTEWEISLDKLLNSLPNIGFICKKTYYEPLKRKPVSDVCYYKDVILRNDPCITCLSDLRRITHVIHCHPDDLVSKARADIFDKDAVMEVMNYYHASIANPECEILEQHCFLDLDDDGLEEPYVVSVHKQTQKLLQVKARYEKDGIEFNKDDEVLRIQAIQYFTDYHFLPAPDGSFMSVGFGTLMLHLNETVNTILNELIDAGALANMQTGIMDSRIKFMGGKREVVAGEWIRAKGVIGQELKDGIYPLQYKEPSSVLFQLLGLLLQAAKDLTSSTDALQGAQNATNVPATSMLAMIEQGLKLYSSLQKRINRALKEEYQKIYYLNGKHVNQDEYVAILGHKYSSIPNIYKTKVLKVIPIFDPNMSSDAQKLTQAQVIMGMAQAPDSLLNKYAAQKRMLEAAKVSNIEELLPKQAAQQPPKPDPKMIDVQGKHQAKMAEVQIKAKAQDLKEKEFVAKLAKLEAEIDHLHAGAADLASKAAATQHSMGVDDFNSKLDVIKTKMQSVAQAHQQISDQNNQAKELQIKQQQVNNQHQQAMAGHAINAQDNQDQNDLQQQEINNNAQQQQSEGQDDQGSDPSMDQSPPDQEGS